MSRLIYEFHVAPAQTTEQAQGEAKRMGLSPEDYLRIRQDWTSVEPLSLWPQILERALVTSNYAGEAAKHFGRFWGIWGASRLTAQYPNRTPKVDDIERGPEVWAHFVLSTSIATGSVAELGTMIAVLEGTRFKDSSWQNEARAQKARLEQLDAEESHRSQMAEAQAHQEAYGRAAALALEKAKVEEARSNADRLKNLLERRQELLATRTKIERQIEQQRRQLSREEGQAAEDAAIDQELITEWFDVLKLGRSLRREIRALNGGSKGEGKETPASTFRLTQLKQVVEEVFNADEIDKNDLIAALNGTTLATSLSPEEIRFALEFALSEAATWNSVSDSDIEALFEAVLEVADTQWSTGGIPEAFIESLQENIETVLSMLNNRDNLENSETQASVFAAYSLKWIALTRAASDSSNAPRPLTRFEKELLDRRLALEKRADLGDDQTVFAELAKKVEDFGLIETDFVKLIETLIAAEAGDDFEDDDRVAFVGMIKDMIVDRQQGVSERHLNTLLNSLNTYLNDNIEDDDEQGNARELIRNLSVWGKVIARHATWSQTHPLAPTAPESKAERAETRPAASRVELPPALAAIQEAYRAKRQALRERVRQAGVVRREIEKEARLRRQVRPILSRLVKSEGDQDDLLGQLERLFENGRDSLTRPRFVAFLRDVAIREPFLKFFGDESDEDLYAKLIVKIVTSARLSGDQATELAVTMIAINGYSKGDSESTAIGVERDILVPGALRLAFSRPNGLSAANSRRIVRALEALSRKRRDSDKADAKDYLAAHITDSRWQSLPLRSVELTEDRLARVNTRLSELDREIEGARPRIP